MKRILPYRSDLYTVFCVLASLLLLVFPFFIRMNIFVGFLWIILSCFFGFCVNLINHNQSHVPTFSSKWANLIFDMSLVLCRGASASFIRIIHGQHHRYEGQKEDWFSPENEENGNPIWSLWSYIRNTAGRFKSGGATQFSHMGSDFLRVLWAERIILIIWVGFFLYMSIAKFLLFVLVPWLFGNFFLVLTNLFFHKYTESNSKVNVSVNFLSPIENALFFNGGYHTAHHLRPNAHWSELPKIHKELVKGKARKDLLQNSMFAYFFKYFILRYPRTFYE